MADNTTKNIPTTDPALLAAQSRAGQAGVDAYNAAIATMQADRQQAVAAAMASATARGGPDAGAGAGGDVGRMYDSRISQAQQALGNYQASLAGGAQRAVDYNAAVNSARSLIPAQVELVTAPIRAEGQNKVWQIGMEGRQAVDAIEAKRRLAEIQLALAQATAGRGRGGGGGGGGGGGKAEKLTGEKLASMLSEGARAAMQAEAESTTRLNTPTSRVTKPPTELAAAQKPAGPVGSNPIFGKIFGPIQKALEGMLAAAESSNAVAQSPSLNRVTSRVTRPPLPAPGYVGRGGVDLGPQRPLPELQDPRTGLFQPSIGRGAIPDFTGTLTNGPSESTRPMIPQSALDSVRRAIENVRSMRTRPSTLTDAIREQIAGTSTLDPAAQAVMAQLAERQKDPQVWRDERIKEAMRLIGTGEYDFNQSDVENALVGSAANNARSYSDFASQLAGELSPADQAAQDKRDLDTANQQKRAVFAAKYGGADLEKIANNTGLTEDDVVAAMEAPDFQRAAGEYQTALQEGFEDENERRNWLLTHVKGGANPAAMRKLLEWFYG